MIEKHMITFEKVQRDDYTTGCLLDYSYIKEHYKVITIGLSKQQALDADLKANQQIDFIANLAQDGNIIMLFITEEAKKTILNF